MGAPVPLSVVSHALPARPSEAEAPGPAFIDQAGDPAAIATFEATLRTAGQWQGERQHTTHDGRASGDDV
ncbi:MAG: hypothetical protein HGA45_41190 [Chloroflexales bacterium]|nr:hypothetical protein [Chloroflexales bacterium]